MPEGTLATPLTKPATRSPRRRWIREADLFSEEEGILPVLQPHDAAAMPAAPQKENGPDRSAAVRPVTGGASLGSARRARSLGGGCRLLRGRLDRGGRLALDPHAVERAPHEEDADGEADHRGGRRD